MSEIYRLAIVEPNDLYRLGLRSLFQEPEWARIVAVTRSVDDLRTQAGELDLDMVVLDPSAEEGSELAAISRLREAAPQARLMALSSEEGEEVVFHCLEAGVDGFLGKSCTSEEVLMGARTVLRGQTYLSPNVLGDITKGFVESRRRTDPLVLVASLTTRERQVFELVGKRHKNHEIADILNISVKTVEKHRAGMMRKLRLGSPSEVRSRWAEYAAFRQR